MVGWVVGKTRAFAEREGWKSKVLISLDSSGRMRWCFCFHCSSKLLVPRMDRFDCNRFIEDAKVNTVSDVKYSLIFCCQSGGERRNVNPANFTIFVSGSQPFR